MTRTLRLPPEARVIQVIEVVVSEGAGVKDEPVRRVFYYYSFDGKVLARGDAYEDEQRKEAES